MATGIQLPTLMRRTANSETEEQDERYDRQADFPPSR